MRRNFLILTAIILSILTGFANGQDKGLNSLENGKVTKSADNANRLFIAYQSAKYGRLYKSPDALILAASILKQIPSDKVLPDKQVEGGQPDSVQKNNKANQTADTFLKEARALAKKDRFLLGRIKFVSTLEPEDRGALDGPKRASTEVRAYATDIITVRFKGGENAVIAVSGDGDTDLDLYVYDENGNLVGADTNGLDDCKVRFFPKWTGTFKIKVKNLGNVYNRYLLVTN